MHEMSLVQGLLQQLHDIAGQHNTSRVLRVTMVIGPLSGVVVDSFKFGFAILSKEDALVKDAVLEIVTPEVGYRCSNCRNLQKTSGERPHHCAACGDTLLIAEEGNDLILQQVEME
jgi:hydrogenase nickel incorporation protein HypA/HybF